MSGIDLHMHSVFSDDGEFSPEQLADACILNDVKLFSVTDHNNTRGVETALRYCAGKAAEAIPGIEMDCVCRGVSLHLLGYGIDHKDPVFEEIWSDVLGKQQKASKKLVRQVRALGIEFSDEKIAALSKWGIVTGEMIAEAAMEYDTGRKNKLLGPYYEGGARSDNPYVNFYWDFCSKGKPAYSPIEFMDIERATGIIQKTGGIPVLAHPGVNLGENAELLDAICGCGIRGIEVYCSYHNEKQAAFYREYAHRKQLLITCGSDFHGKTKPSVRIGGTGCPHGEAEEIAENLLELLRRR